MYLLLGGSISGYQYSNLTATNSTFIGNKAIYGGAIFAQFKTFYNLIRCSIHDNQGILFIIILSLECHFFHYVISFILYISNIYGRRSKYPR